MKQIRLRRRISSGFAFAAAMLAATPFLSAEAQQQHAHVHGQLKLDVAIDGPTAEAIIRTISDNEIGIASFDPLVAHHRTTENVTGDMDQVVREFARIASATDCSIEIVHHTRKPAPGKRS